MFRKIKKSLLHKATLPVALAMLGAPAFAHTPETPRKQGVQAEGQAQRSPLPQTGAVLRMPGADREPGKAAAKAQAVATDGKLRTMESALKNPKAAVGELPPRRQVQAPVSRGGTQKDPIKELSASGSHLRLVLKITPEGGSELVSATEMPGEARLTQEPKGDLVYEVSDEAQTLAVEALSDPFEAHSFGGPEDDRQGHGFHALTEATIAVTVPQWSLRSELDKLNVRLYRITSGPPVEEITVASVQRLKEGRRLRSLVEARGEPLGRQIREKGVQLRE